LRERRRAAALALVVALLVPGSAVGRPGAPAPGGSVEPAAQRTEMPEPIAYTLRFPEARHNAFEVEATVPTDGRDAVELLMAVWTPGSYLVREFARHVEGLAAATEAGEPLPVEKTRKNRWRVETRGAPRIVVRYRLRARETSVRTNFVDAGFALINGAPTFLTLADGPPRPHDLRVEPPPEWRVVVSALPPHPAPSPKAGEHAFRAADFDALVDSPLYAGNAAVHRFEVGGVPHLLVNEGEGEGEEATWDGPGSAAATERIVREQAKLWGAIPYPRYVFFNLLTGAGGGLEHRDSTVLMTSRWRLRTREGRLDWYGLVSHELFHAWNVKRLRPVELGPFDYEREVHTESLWVAEGVTSYYDDLLVHRAGLSTRKEYLAELSKRIESVETAPGHLVQSLASASFDAWIKFYRKDEDFVNTGADYYRKGAVVAFLLDARIRRATGGGKSLDDALRLAYARYSGERGFRPEDFRATVSEVAGGDLGGWFERHVDSAEPLDYSEALDWLGLRFADPKMEKKEKDEEDEAGKGDDPVGWLGLAAEARDGRLVVTEVKRGTPAWEGGLNVDDEILAVGEHRLPPDGWQKRLAAYRPGERQELLVARRERLARLPVVFGEEPGKRWKLEVAPNATPEQKERLAAWLGSPEELTPRP
jgi:predicted metalloprotease with PDZ domain